MLRFGLAVSPSAGPGADPVRAAVAAEQAGYDFVSTSDHPCGLEPTYESWTMLTWLAARTTRIGIAPRVLGVPYRPPAMVAKMAETLDRLSGGRLVLGLGGGYSDDEFRAFGLRVPTPRDKVDGLAEAIEICRGLWTEKSFGYEGRLFRTEAADLEPKPDRSIPIWLGTFGPRALAVTGRLADGWIPSFGSAPPERIPAMRDRIFAAALAAGRDPGELTLAYHVPVTLGSQQDPGVVSGSVQEVVERLAGFAGLGFTAFSLVPVGPDEADLALRLAEEVVPALRA